MLNRREMNKFSLCINFNVISHIRVIYMTIQEEGKQSLDQFHRVCKRKPSLHFILFHIVSHSTFLFCYFLKSNMCNITHEEERRAFAEDLALEHWGPGIPQGHGQVISPMLAIFWITPFRQITSGKTHVKCHITKYTHSHTDECM